MKEFLSHQQVTFREYNIVEDRNAFEEMWLISGQKAAPVISVNNEVVIGFKKDRLQTLLKGKS